TEPAHGHPRTAQGAMRLDGFAGILGTARVETAAAPEQGADQIAVRSNEADQQPGHHLGRRSSKRTPSSLIMLRVASPTGAGKRITISTAGSVARRLRNCSRTMRLTRLRTLARFARRLATTTPRRACGNSLGRKCS